MPDSLVKLFIDGGLARVVFDRPAKRNAFTAPMWTELTHHLGELSRRDDVKALIVTGSGGSFSAGADLGSVRNTDGTESSEYRALVDAGLRAMASFPRPTVAVVDGAAIGAGCILALHCDVRFTSPRSKFAIPAVRYGLMVGQDSLDRLVALVGPGRASQFLLSGVAWSGTEAARAGLVEDCSEDPDEYGRQHATMLLEGDPDTALRTRQAILRATFSGRA
jgi:enoyl-CoA hydratase/carnithine racemase